MSLSSSKLLGLKSTKFIRSLIVGALAGAVLLGLNVLLFRTPYGALQGFPWSISLPNLPCDEPNPSGHCGFYIDASIVVLDYAVWVTLCFSFALAASYIVNRKRILRTANKIGTVILLTLTMFMPATSSALSPEPDASTTSPQDGSLTLTEVVVSCTPGDLVVSPAGCVPRNCSFGSVKEVVIKDQVIVFDNDTRIQIPSSCMQGTPVVSKTLKYSNGSIQTYTPPTMNPPGYASSSGSPSPTFTGWAEYAGYSNCFLFWCTELSDFMGNWTVPRPPVNTASQTIYLFIGEIDYWETQILQPVLQWGPSCNLGGNYWSIASYFVTGGICTHSTFVSVNTGDPIFGRITKMVGGNWRIKTVDTVCPSTCTTTLTVQANEMFNARVALESWYVNSCSDFPASGSTTFSSLKITGGTPGWWTYVEPYVLDECGALRVTTSYQGGGFSTVIPYWTYVDGIGSCSMIMALSCQITLNTDVANDLILVAQTGGSACVKPQDSHGFPYTIKQDLKYPYQTSTNHECVSFATWSSSGSKTITCKQTSSQNAICLAFGLSKVDTSNIFDTMCTEALRGSGDNGPYGCTVTTSHARDILIGTIGASTSITTNPTEGEGFTSITTTCPMAGSGYEQCVEIQVISTIQIKSFYYSWPGSTPKDFGDIGLAIRLTD